jgi:class 3 adenylate cyclase
VSRLASEPARPARQQTTQRRRVRLPIKHLRSRLTGLAWAVFLGIFLGKAWYEGPLPGLVIPALIALTAWQGTVLGGKRNGFWTGAFLVSLTLLVFPLFMHHSTETVPFVPFVFLAGAGGLTGALGALVAQKRKPREVNPAEEETAAASHGPMNRAALLDQMFALQRQLTEQKRRAAFLSVDVVGSSAIKQAALTTGDELAVEHAFVQYHRWVEQVVCAHGGRVHATAGDGVMCLFDDIGGPFDASPETRAVRAARDLQTRLATFNEAQQACLSAPLRIRCGVSAGEVAIEPGVPVGHLQSAVIDRAATLQKRAAPGDIVVDHETAVTALTELGALAPLPSPRGVHRRARLFVASRHCFAARSPARPSRRPEPPFGSLHRPASVRRGCFMLTGAMVAILV